MGGEGSPSLKPGSKLNPVRLSLTRPSPSQKMNSCVHLGPWIHYNSIGKMISSFKKNIYLNANVYIKYIILGFILVGASLTKKQKLLKFNLGVSIFSKLT